MWLPLWPIVFGGLGGISKSMPLPEMIAKLGSQPGPVSIIYGAFCGMISMAVVKAIKHAAEQKGIDVEIPDLSVAKLVAKKDNTSSRLKVKSPDPKHEKEPDHLA